MIERYSDHAANERTFLAWVRTAIAVMAFGFLVEKFDLFLQLAGREIAGNSRAAGVLPVRGETIASITGLLLMLLGGATMVLAIVRFRRTARDIDCPEPRADSGVRMDATLAGLLVLLGAVIFVYLLYTTLTGI